LNDRPSQQPKRVLEGAGRSEASGLPFTFTHHDLACEVYGTDEPSALKLGSLWCMRQHRWLAAVAIALLVSLAGCGDDDSSESGATSRTEEATTSAPEVSHEEFVARLNRICEAGNRKAAQLETEFQEATESNNYAQAAEILSQAIKTNEPFIAQFEELTVPPEDQAAFDRYATETRQIAGLNERLVDALREQDPAEIERLGSIAEEARNRRTQAAIELGADECGT
jgi:hypothetical protein